MKKVFCILFSLFFVFPALAEGETPAINKAEVAATASYVDGAYSAMNTAKQDKLTSSNVVVGTDNGPFVSAVTASNGTVTVTKSEVTIPVGSTTSSTRAVIWLE